MSVHAAEADHTTSPSRPSKKKAAASKHEFRQQNKAHIAVSSFFHKVLAKMSSATGPPRLWMPFE